MTSATRFSRLPSRLRYALLLAISVPMAIGCSEGPTEMMRSDLDRAEARWASTYGNASYTMVQQKSCFCIVPTGAKITVVNNVVTAGETLQATRPLTVQEQQYFMTVPQIFAYIRETLALKDARVDVTYDPVSGYPRTLSTDPYPAAADDELGITITGLVKLSN